MVADFPRLSRYVRERRQQLDLRQDEVDAAGGPSDTLVSQIERDEWHPTERYTSTLRKLDVGLQWQPGSARRILEGGEPQPLGGGDMDLSEVDDDDLIAELCARLYSRRAEVAAASARGAGLRAVARPDRR